MKKKILIILFISYLVLPTIIYAFYNKNIETTENRNLQEFPKYDNNLTKYMILLENYYNDHLPFRSEIISIKNKIDKKLFNELDSSQVIFGKNDWYFYKGENDNAIKQYIRADNFSEKQMADDYEKIENKLEEFNKLGVKVIIIIGTNKEEIYQEFMPDKYKINNEKEITAEKYVNYLINKGVNVVYAKDILIDNKNQDSLLYYKDDTHWNVYGSYFASKLILENLNLKVIEPSFIKYVIYNGDITKMTGINGLKNEDYKYEAIYNDESKINKDKKGNGYIIYNNNNFSSNNRLFIVGDSFSDNLTYHLKHYFKETHHIRKDGVLQNALNLRENDVLVIESVERYINSFANKIESIKIQKD